MKKNVVVVDGEVPPQEYHTITRTNSRRSSRMVRRAGGIRSRGTRGRRGFTTLSASVSIMSTAGVLLVGLGEHGLLRGWGQDDSASGGSPLACGLAYASVATSMAAEVQGNGEILETVVEGGGSGGGGDIVRKVRVSSDVRARFPVTIVEEQPARMVVIGDVHGDLGEDICPTAKVDTTTVLLILVYNSSISVSDIIVRRTVVHSINMIVSYREVV